MLYGTTLNVRLCMCMMFSTLVRHDFQCFGTWQVTIHLQCYCDTRLYPATCCSRLDSTLREVCAEDIEAVCGYERDSLDSVEGFDARVIQCLQVPG